jgi:2-deoxy-D-gluconate 3-dehydrogenase
LKTQSPFQLNQKVALVTGAARGIGQAVAIGLAEAGADVYLIDILDCAETAGQITVLGQNVYAEQLDLAEMDKRKAGEIISKVMKALGGLDILVNNAGIIRRSPAAEYSDEDWRKVMDINLNTVFFLSQAAASHFMEHQKAGKIVNVASVLSFQGGLQVPSYAASKSGVMGLTKALSNEWASHGINVNAIAPGYYKTSVTAGIRSDAQRSRDMLERIPAGRWGELDDLKGPAVFLASGASDYMHGSVVPVDGGWLSR